MYAHFPFIDASILSLPNGGEPKEKKKKQAVIIVMMMTVLLSDPPRIIIRLLAWTLYAEALGLANYHFFPYFDPSGEEEGSGGHRDGQLTKSSCNDHV